MKLKQLKTRFNLVLLIALTSTIGLGFFVFYLKQFETIHDPDNGVLFKEVSVHKMFLIHPGALFDLLDPQQQNDLRWRFDFNPPQNTTTTTTTNRTDCIPTMAMFDHDVQRFLPFLKNEYEWISSVHAVVPFGNGTQRLAHMFLKINNCLVHLVVMFQVKHFLWISSIPPNDTGIWDQYPIEFGRYEQIFDPIQPIHFQGYLIPDDTVHFLGQIPTSRYMPCSPSKKEWFRKNKVKVRPDRIQYTIDAITSLKSFMKELRWEFWIMCGTLLGWYRHCDPIPYTTDDDFSTWPKYLQGQELSSMLKRLAPKHGLELLYRWGEPTASLEYSFKTIKSNEKVDLFFTYDHGDRFALLTHVNGTYRYNLYPRYTLCSVEMLGYKLLAPCDAHAVIEAEYGKHWQRPMPDWNYLRSPKNGDATKKYTFAMPQFKQFASY